MLLQRLKEYAERSEGKLPAPYYRVRSIRWAIQLRDDGTPAVPTMTDRADDENPSGAPMPVPYIQRSGVRPPPMLLADDLRYVTRFGDDERDRSDSEPARKNQEFMALVARWRDGAPDDRVAGAVATFFERGLHLTVDPPPGTAKATDVVAIMVNGEWAHDRPSAKRLWASVARDRKSSASTGICLICGTVGPLLETIPEMIKAGAIPAARGQARDAALVSVNKPAQGRGGKIQLGNTPVCDRCGSLTMSALNGLLAGESSRYRTTDSVLTWWLRDGRKFGVMDWLNQSSPEQVEKLLAEVRGTRQAGHAGTIDANAFCAITLSVNQSRAVVRDWLEVPLHEVQEHLDDWRADHAVADLWRDGPQTVPLWLLAASTGRWGSENGQERYLRGFMPDGCERDLLLTALRGTRPPGYLLAHVLNRIRADRHVDLPRAALLRLILVRSPGPKKENSYMTGLDPDLPSPPYQCGRMFAVLEDIQRAALGREVNATIADKYLPAATATPLAILTMLHKNASGHLKRLRRTNTGAFYALSSRLDDVMEHLPAHAGIPATLPLAGQAEFILGYHHQRAAGLTAARARADKQKGTPENGGEQ
jgi:CRISPR-associated protein Csd1